MGTMRVLIPGFDCDSHGDDPFFFNHETVAQFLGGGFPSRQALTLWVYKKETCEKSLVSVLRPSPPLFFGEPAHPSNQIQDGADHGGMPRGPGGRAARTWDSVPPFLFFVLLCCYI